MKNKINKKIFLIILICFSVISNVFSLVNAAKPAPQENCYCPFFLYPCKQGYVSMKEKCGSISKWCCAVKCADTDGIDYYTKGQVIVYNEDYTQQSASYDICYDTNKLREYFCGGNNQLQTEDFICPNGCYEGACIEESTEPTESIRINGYYMILNEKFPDDVYSSPIYFYTGVLETRKIIRALINFDLSGVNSDEIEKMELVI